MDNYKNTLNIGFSNFKMKGQLAIKEPYYLKQWKDLNLVQNIQKKRLETNDGHFILHDGPPYANGSLHIGHGLNKVLKDFVIRYRTNINEYAPFKCGWDTHGLPIALAVTKQQNVNSEKVGIKAFRTLCSKYADEQIQNHVNGFSKLGLLTDFNDKYITKAFNYELTQLKFFIKMFEQGLVYRHLKPVYWSPSSETALADAEIEYQDLKTPAIYVKFELLENDLFKNLTSCIIWTTTPWTIAANQLLAIGKKIQYVLVQNKNEQFICSKKLLPKIKIDLEWNDFKLIKELNAQDLIGLKTKHPLYDRLSEIVLGHHVHDDNGTGIVHIASGFGEDDYLIGQEHNLEVFAPLDSKGHFTKKVLDKDLIGKFYLQANKIIIEKLQNNNCLLSLNSIIHSAGVDWRTNKPIIYLATKQWFVNIKKIKKDLLNQINKVSWNPTWGGKYITDMIKNRDDWCISRQRIWGTPIICFYDNQNELILNSEILNYVISIFEKHQSIEIWFEESADFFLPKQYQNKGYWKETDIMDVWFDSGISHLAVSQNRENWKFPVDLYFEGHDQFRGWFNSSLITGVINNNQSPYKKVIAHGFVNDKNNRKMSKSKGNYYGLNDFIKNFGADIFRLWVAQVDYISDIKFSEDNIKQVKQDYRKIRNTLRFLMTNLYDFNFAKDLKNNLQEVDLYVLYQVQKFQKQVDKAYRKYNFKKIIKLIKLLINNILSTFYLDFAKDILYVQQPNSLERRQTQTVLFYTLKVLLDTIKPILVFTSEEIYENIKLDKIKANSVHELTNFKLDVSVDQKIINKWDYLLKIKEDINKSLENARNNNIITKSITSNVEIYFKNQLEFEINLANLSKYFILGNLVVLNKKPDLSRFDEQQECFIKVTLKQGVKCQRCWKITDKYAYQTLCESCLIIVKQLEAK